MLKLLTKNRLFALLLVFALAVGLAGCEGDDGRDGVAGQPGQEGLPGQDRLPGQDGQDGVGLAPLAIKTLVVENLAFGIDAGGFVTASFDVTDGAEAVTGLTTADSTIYLAGLVEGDNGDSDEWQYWTGVTDTSLTEGPSGTYLLTSDKLASDVPAGTTTQRGIIRMARSGFNTVVNSYDFAIADPTTEVAAGKDVVNDASCKECHGYGVTIHGYGRNDTKTCVVCHSPNYNATMADHEADMVTMVHQIHTGKAVTLGSLHWSGHGENWSIEHNTDPVANVPLYPFAYPGTIVNCAKCHNTVAQADNWETKPTMTACNSCHTTVKFDGTAYTGIKGVAGKTHITLTNNAICALCHVGDTLPIHITVAHKPAARDDAGQRLVEATISGVTVDADGGVTVAFSVTENGVAKADLTAASFTLAKLVPSTTGTPSYWQSYLSKVRTKDVNAAPVIQGRDESSTAGTLTNNNDGTYTYKFGLMNAEPEGDIRNVTHAHNINQDSPANGPNQMQFPVAYEPTLTHRVAIGIDNNKTNAFFDFVPAGNVAETRNIVSRDACNKCHGDSQLHKGFALEYCVGCHNQNSFDPFSGPVTDNTLLTELNSPIAGSSSVELERLVHKIHMGKDLEKGYRVNAAADAVTGHIYDGLQYPSGVPSDSRTPKASDCRVCHDESNAAMTEADYWLYGSRACGSCHDSDLATAHISANTDNGFATCTLCHAPGRVAPVDEAHYGKQ